MKEALGFLMMRFLLIAAVVVGAILVAFVVAIVLKRAGKLDRARELAAPLVREVARNRGRLTGAVADIATDRLAGRYRQPDPAHRESTDRRDR